MSIVYSSNLILYTHTDFTQIFEIESSEQNLDLNNYSVSCQFKKYNSTSTFGSFNTTILNSVTQKIKIHLSSTETKDLKAGKYLYDLVITDSYGFKTRIVEGNLIIKKSITRVL